MFQTHFSLHNRSDVEATHPFSFYTLCVRPQFRLLSLPLSPCLSHNFDSVCRERIRMCDIAHWRTQADVCAVRMRIFILSFASWFRRIDNSYWFGNLNSTLLSRIVDTTMINKNNHKVPLAIYFSFVLFFGFAHPVRSLFSSFVSLVCIFGVLFIYNLRIASICCTSRIHHLFIFIISLIMCFAFFSFPIRKTKQ